MSDETAINTIIITRTVIHTEFMFKLATFKYRKKSSYLKNSIDLVSHKCEC